MNTKEETTATTVRALNDALNARDREATVALFASDGVFRPGAAGASFEGPEAIADALFGFLGSHKSGQFETARHDDYGRSPLPGLAELGGQGRGMDGSPGPDVPSEPWPLRPPRSPPTTLSGQTPTGT